MSDVIYQLEVTLRDIEPRIWRRLHVDGNVRLDRLHRVLQKAMGWRNAHLHEYVAQGRRYGVPEPDEPHYEVEDERLMSLRRVAPTQGITFEYVYDLGDNWTHGILVEGIHVTDEPLRHAVCIGGERACPPEDAGGAPGYERLLDALRDPDHDEQNDMRRWVGRRFDPEKFDLVAVNRKLRTLR